MKKILALILSLCLLLSCTAAFADVKETVAAAENLTHDELVALAQAESGNFIV